MENITHILGWIGAILILIAYFLVSSHRVRPKSRSYQSLNLIGAVLIGINVFYDASWPSLALQIAWAGIAIKFLIHHD